MQTRVWTQLPTSNKPLARAYLQAAVVGDVCSIFGGYDGHTCISDFRCIVLPREQQQSFQPQQPMQPTVAASGSIGSNGGGAGGSFGNPLYNPFLAGDLLNLSLNAQVDSLLMTYGYGGGFGNSSADSLNRQQLQQLLIHVGTALRSRSAGSSSNPSSSASGGGSYPFSTAALDGVVDLGFPRERVLAVMARMHAAGQNTANANLVVDMCIKDSADAEAAASDSLPAQSNGSASLDRQNSERAALKKKMTELQEKQDEAQTCKICFDETINCALRECGHLAVCTTCADSLIKNSKPCPICQKPIKGKLKIFWS